MSKRSSGRIDNSDTTQGRDGIMHSAHDSRGRSRLFSAGIVGDRIVQNTTGSIAFSTREARSMCAAE
jgi:hypothetical protein